MSRSAAGNRRVRGGGATAVTLVVLTVVGISVALVVWRSRPDRTREPVRFSGASTVIPLPSLLPPATLAEPVRVTVVRDPSAAGYYDNAAAFDAVIARWQAAVGATGADVRVAAPTDVDALTDAQVLVVPSSPCLGVDAREALQRAAARGQGVILTTTVGLFDAGCSRVGYGVIVSATGAARADTLETRDMVYVTVPGGSVLGLGLPPGARIEVNPGAHVALRRAGRDAYYSEYDMDPAPAGRRPLVDGAIVHAPYGQGRAVYWGFELHDVANRPWNGAVVALLVRNSIAWAAGLPLASVEPWPNGRAAAAVLAQDVEAEFTNARHALDSLRAAGVPATYYLTSALALRHRRLARALAAHGEIGTHTDRHQLLGGAPADSQLAWLQRTRRELTKLLGRPVEGLRPPEEQFDTTTLAQWLRAGGSYVFGANNSRVAAPELLAVGGDTVLLLARVTDDDVIAVHDVGPDPVRTLTDRYLADFARIRAVGGLYLLSYHSQLLARPELVPALANLARKIADDDRVWRTTAGDVATWWRARAEVTVDVRRDSTGLITLLVRNRGSSPVRGAVLRVALRPGERVVQAEVPRFPAGAGVARLALPPLAAGETRTVSFRVGPTRPGTGGSRAGQSAAGTPVPRPSGTGRL